MYVKMFDHIDKTILFSLNKEKGKTKYQISKETGIPYQKINYRVDVLNEYLYIDKNEEKNNNGKKRELYLLSERVIKLEESNLIAVTEQSNLFIGSIDGLNFKNISISIKNGKLKINSDCY